MVGKNFQKKSMTLDPCKKNLNLSCINCSCVLSRVCDVYGENVANCIILDVVYTRLISKDVSHHYKMGSSC